MDKALETNIKFANRAFVEHSGMLEAVYSEMAAQLQAFAKNPSAKRVDIEKADKRLKTIADFYNQATELVEMMNKGLLQNNETINRYTPSDRSEASIMEEYLQRLIEYAQICTQTALKAKNKERASVCIRLFLRLSDSVIPLNFIRRIMPEQKFSLEGEEICIEAAPKLENWMKEGERVYKRRLVYPLQLVEHESLRGAALKTELQTGRITKVEKFTIGGSNFTEDYLQKLEVEWEDV